MRGAGSSKRFMWVALALLTACEGSEAHYRYGRADEAFEYLMAQVSPELERREYPENPFTVVGVVVRWLAGVRPLATDSLVETRARLPEAVEWIELSDVPVLDGSLRLRHRGQEWTRLTRQSGGWAAWRAVFAGAHRVLYVDGEPMAAESRLAPGGGVESFVRVGVARGRARTVSVRPE